MFANDTYSFSDNLFHSMSFVTIEHISKAKVIVDLFGATVISWVLPSGKEMLYLSSLCDKTHKSPIRGGIPVIFPQFSNGILFLSIMNFRRKINETWFC